MDETTQSELDFTADEWFNITGRGWVAAFKNCHQLPEGMKTPAVLTNRYVRIDGKEYWVTGVEMFVIGIGAPSYNRNHSFGLLVRGER